MTANENQTPVANLAAARKEQAAARRRHPAGKQAPAAKKAPAKKPPAKAPAKKAPAVAPGKVRWTRLEDKTGAVEQDATCNGHTWQLRRAEGGWTVKMDGKLVTPKPVSYAEAGRLIVAAAKQVAA